MPFQETRVVRCPAGHRQASGVARSKEADDTGYLWCDKCNLVYVSEEIHDLHDKFRLPDYKELWECAITLHLRARDQTINRMIFALMMEALINTVVKLLTEEEKRGEDTVRTPEG